MGQTSAIEWTDATWNPWQGCTKVSEACANCYMFSDLKRYGRDPTVVVRSKPPTFNLPLKRHRDGSFAIPAGWKVFTCSWSDWFHEQADDWRAEAWDIVRQRDDLIFQIVTKRTHRIRECLPPDWGDGWPHVWLIATVENHHWAEVRIRELRGVPAAVRGLSCEPLLGPINFDAMTTDPLNSGFACTDGLGRFDGEGPPQIHWVIAGGESGHQARPTHPAWVRSLRDQCREASVPFFFKQWGEWLPQQQMVPVQKADAFHYSTPRTKLDDDLLGYRIGKKAAGRLLDGREWSEFPEVQHAACS